MGVKHFENRWRWDYLNNKGIIEMVPVSWLEDYMIKNPDYKTTDTHGNEVDDNALREHILKEGLQHAGVIEVSRTANTAKIAAGNHRLRIAIELAHSYFPFYVVILDEYYDLEHKGIYKPKNIRQSILTGTKGMVVAAPSDVFYDLKDRTFCKS